MEYIFQPKDQIIYVPQHANGNYQHPDCELGFVVDASKGHYIYCRFFSKEYGYKCDLRTKANSEGCPPHTIFPLRHKDPEVIDAMWEKYVLELDKSNYRKD